MLLKKYLLGDFGTDPIKNYKEELQNFCDKKQLTLQFFKNTDGRHKRVYFLIEDVKSAILGFFTRPKPTREYDDRAFNCISKADRINLKQHHGVIDENKTIKGIVLQIWENNRVVIIPVDELEKLATFKRKGNFNIKKDGSYFVLVTPSGDDNIRLKEGIDKILDYL
jgi:hypothetical protein